MASEASRRRRRRVLLGLGLLVLLVAGGAVFVLSHGPGNVSNPDVAFEQGGGSPAGKKAKKGRQAEPFIWPTYGYTADRRRVVDIPKALRPPYRRRWSFAGGALIEFPPVVSEKSLFVLQDDGVVASIDKENGKVRWAKNVGALAASSPHLDFAGERLFLTVLEHYDGGTGRVMAVSTKSGNSLWSRELPSRTESSPLAANGLVYFGTEDGTVYALTQSDGKLRWSFKAAGAVKGALALKDGRLYFGDYAGKVYAIRASNGKPVWESSTQGAKFGFASGRFYATAAVAYGRVYIGNVDGYVYSFSADTGELAWRTKTNGYVYASAAVGAVPGGKPTVYAGSYDGTFYALDARSGAVRWGFGGNGRISGPATLIGDTVYFADLGRRRTFGLDARTGRKVFEFPRGGYATLVTDRETLFVVGYGAMYALEPSRQAKRRPGRRPRARRSAAPRATAPPRFLGLRTPKR